MTATPDLTPATAPADRRSPLDRFFAISVRGSNLRTEVLAGLTTLLATAYAVVVVPRLLAPTGFPLVALTTAVILMFALATLFMALYANLPFAVGPGLGGAGLLGTTMVAQEHIPVGIALATVLFSGIAFLALTLAGLRELISRLVPLPVKQSIGCAVGLFIALLGFREGGLTVANPATNTLGLGHLFAPTALLTLLSFGIGAVLMARRMRGGLLIAIVVATLVGIPLGVTKVPHQLVALPASLTPVAFKVDVLGALRPEYFPYAFSFFTSEFFSTMGTLLAVAALAGLLDKHGDLPGINRPFVVDSSSVIGGSLLGVPSMTAYLESGAGVEAGGKTGLVALVVAAGYAVFLLLTPLAVLVPTAATAGVLIVIGLTMALSIRNADLSDFSSALPALLTVAGTVIANNFGVGISAGLLSYVVLMVLSGRVREVHWGLYVVSAFLVYFFWSLAR
jgi:AGZA family xanthine/uracil permease-like MFS transporter